MGLRGRASSRAGRAPQPVGRCSHWGHDIVSPLGTIRPNPKAMQELLHQVNFSISQSESRAGAACRSTGSPRDLRLLRVTPCPRADPGPGEVPMARQGVCLQPGAAVVLVQLRPEWWEKEAQHQFVC